MRDLLNKLDTVLDESVGLANRKPGEQFSNDQGQVMTFNGLTFYPESGQYDDDIQVDAAVQQLAEQEHFNPSAITWTNNRTASSLAFGIAAFTDQQGEPLYFGRWFKTIHTVNTQNNFPNTAIPGYRFKGKGGAKEATGYKPSEILTDFTGNTPESIYNQIATKFGANSAEANATRAFIESTSFPVEVVSGNMNFAAFRDYFCEMLQPIALVMNKPVKGNAQEAADIFFGSGKGFSDCTISFNQSTTGGLSDSALTNANGITLNISTKGGKGASASTTNLYNSLVQLAKTKEGSGFLNDHEDVVDILTTIASSSAVEGPLKLAVQYGIISEDDKNQIQNVRGKTAKDPIVGQGLLSDNLEKLYKKRTSSKPNEMNPFSHLVSSIAHETAAYINNNTEFSNVAAEILNHGALIQMYTHAKDNNETFVIEGFTTVYPTKLASTVLLDPNVRYKSTTISGKYSFNIKDGSSTVKEYEVPTVTAEDVKRYGRKPLW
jgi:hypothetical protein